MACKTKRLHMAKGDMINKGTCSGGGMVVSGREVWNVPGWWIFLSGHGKITGVEIINSE